MADAEPVDTVIPAYPEWAVDKGVWLTSIDGQPVEVRLECESDAMWRYVARAGDRVLLVTRFEVAEDMVANIRSAWSILSESLPEAMMEYLL